LTGKSTVCWPKRKKSPLIRSSSDGEIDLEEGRLTVTYRFSLRGSIESNIKEPEKTEKKRRRREESVLGNGVCWYGHKVGMTGERNRLLKRGPFGKKLLTPTRIIRNKANVFSRK